MQKKPFIPCWEQIRTMGKQEQVYVALLDDAYIDNK